MPPSLGESSERRFMLCIDDSSIDNVDDLYGGSSQQQHPHGQQDGGLAPATATPMFAGGSGGTDSATKGNRRAKLVYREIPQGSVYDLVELLKDKIVLGPPSARGKRKPLNRGDEYDDGNDEEWSNAIPAGTVAFLADYLKDKIPMTFPGDKRPGDQPVTPIPDESSIQPRLSFADMLVDQIPHLKSPPRQQLSKSMSSLPSTPTSVQDLAFMLQDKIHMRSPLERRRGGRGTLSDYDEDEDDEECRDNCRCCTQLTKLLTRLEAVVGNSLLVQLLEEEDSDGEHRDDEVSSSSHLSHTMKESENTLLIPKRRGTRGSVARVCNLVVEKSSTRSSQSVNSRSLDVATKTATPNNMALPFSDDSVSSSVHTPHADAVAAIAAPLALQQHLPLDDEPVIVKPRPSWERYRNPQRTAVLPPPLVHCDESVASASASTSTNPAENDDDGTRSSVSGSVISSDNHPKDKIEYEFESPRSSSSATTPSWKCDETETERRLRTEYHLSSRKLRSMRDSALHYSMSTTERAPWDRSKYGNWRQQQQRQQPSTVLGGGSIKKERAWS